MYFNEGFKREGVGDEGVRRNSWQASYGFESVGPYGASLPRVRARVILAPCPRHPETPKMGGNRAWCFTLNNYTEEEYKALQEVPCKYIIMGKEEGKEETPHLQGYVQFASQKRLGGLKDINGRAHWEAAKGNPQQNIDYCSKDGDFWEKGVRPKNGKRSMAERAAMNKDLKTRSLNSLVDDGTINIKEVRMLKNARYDLMAEKPAKKRPGACGIWIHGPPGLGKSHWAREQLQRLTGEEEPYDKAQNQWWCDYQGEKGVLLDDFSKTDRGILQSQAGNLKKWMDKYRAKGQPKGGRLPLQHDYFCVTSQYTPEEIWSDDPQEAEAIRDRCQVIDFRQIYNGPSRRKKTHFIDIPQQPQEGIGGPRRQQEEERWDRPIYDGQEYQP